MDLRPDLASIAVDDAFADDAFPLDATTDRVECGAAAAHLDDTRDPSVAAAERADLDVPAVILDAATPAFAAAAERAELGVAAACLHSTPVPPVVVAERAELGAKVEAKGGIEGLMRTRMTRRSATVREGKRVGGSTVSSTSSGVAYPLMGMLGLSPRTDARDEVIVDLGRKVADLNVKLVKQREVAAENERLRLDVQILEARILEEERQRKSLQFQVEQLQRVVHQRRKRSAASPLPPALPDEMMKDLGFTLRRLDAASSTSVATSVDGDRLDEVVAFASCGQTHVTARGVVLAQGVAATDTTLGGVWEQDVWKVRHRCASAWRSSVLLESDLFKVEAAVNDQGEEEYYLCLILGGCNRRLLLVQAGVGGALLCAYPDGALVPLELIFFCVSLDNTASRLRRQQRRLQHVTFADLVAGARAGEVGLPNGASVTSDVDHESAEPPSEPFSRGRESEGLRSCPVAASGLEHGSPSSPKGDEVVVDASDEMCVTFDRGGSPFSPECGGDSSMEYHSDVMLGEREVPHYADCLQDSSERLNQDSDSPDIVTPDGGKDAMVGNDANGSELFETDTANATSATHLSDALPRNSDAPVASGTSSQLPLSHRLCLRPLTPPTDKRCMRGVVQGGDGRCVASDDSSQLMFRSHSSVEGSGLRLPHSFSDGRLSTIGDVSRESASRHTPRSPHPGLQHLTPETEPQASVPLRFVDRASRGASSAGHLGAWSASAPIFSPTPSCSSRCSCGSTSPYQVPPSPYQVPPARALQSTSATATSVVVVATAVVGAAGGWQPRCCINLPEQGPSQPQFRSQQGVPVPTINVRNESLGPAKPRVSLGVPSGNIAQVLHG